MVKSMKKQAGFMGLEMNGVLITVAILSAVALAATAAMWNDASSDALMQGHTKIVKDARGNFRNAPSFNGLNNTLAVTMEMGPPSWRSGTAIIVNNLGGTITIQPEDIGGTDDGFSVAEQNLSSTECREFVNDIFNDANTITVGSTTVKTVGQAQPNVGTLATACDNATNTITPIYTKA